MASGEKNTRGGGVQFEILKNPGIDFYSGFRGNAQVGIDFYSGFRKKIQVYTFIVASGKKISWGGGGVIRNPKKIQV